MSYTLCKTYVVTDAAGNVVPDDPTSAARIAYNVWLSAGNTPVKDDAPPPAPPAPTPPPPAPVPAPPPATPISECRPWEGLLPHYMDLIYGVGQWTQRTAQGVGSDIAPALVAACDAIRQGFGRGTLVIPPGSWLMKSGLTPAQLSGINVLGVNSMASKIVYDNDAGAALSFSGDGGYTGGGVKGLAIMLEAGHPLSTATPILLQGNATSQPDQLEFDDLYLTAIGDSYWFDGFKAFGNARTAPQGIRVCDMNNVQVFRCRNTGIFLSNVVQWTMRNIGVYSGIGGGNNFYLAGGGAGNTNSTQVYADGLAINGELNVTNCSHFFLRGRAGTLNANASATNGGIVMPGMSVVGAPAASVKVET